MPITTISGSTRASRSRISSPQTTPVGATESSKAAAGSSSASNLHGPELGQTKLDSWLEPPVHIKPSYQDDGLLRRGVVENMAPLGTMPKLGVFKQKPVQTPSHSAPEKPAAASPAPTAAPTIRIIVKQKSAAPSTPAPAPPPPVAPEEDETEEDEELGDGETLDSDDERRTVDGHVQRTSAVSAPSRSRRPISPRDVDDDNRDPVKKPQSAQGHGSLSRASAGRPASFYSSHQQTPASVATRQADLKEFTDKVVEAAVDEALVHFRYPTAWALRTLYDEKSSSPEFLSMIEKVFTQTADANTLGIFTKEIQALKKKGKKQNQACYFFVPPTTENRHTPHKPKAAPYSDRLQPNIASHLAGLRQTRAQEKQRQRELMQQQQQQQQQPVLKQEEAAPTPALQPEAEPEPQLELEPARVPTPSPVPEAEQAPEPVPETETEPVPEPAQEPEAEEPPRKKRKSARRPESAAKMTAKVTANGVNGKQATDTPSRRRTRAASVASSSSTLSSARSVSPPAVAAPQAPEAEEEEAVDAPSRNSPTPASQPITKQRRRPVALRKSKGGNVSPSRPSPTASAAPRPSRSASNSRRQTPAAEQPSATEEQPYEMPAVVDTPNFPNANGKKSKASQLVFTSKVGKIDENDSNVRLRQSARKVTNGPAPWEISNARGNSTPSRQQEASEETTEAETPGAIAPPPRPKTSLPVPRPTPAPREGRSTRSSRKRSHDELEEEPPSPSIPASVAPSTAANSRAGTPALRPTKKPRTGLRVKNSPAKKKNGPLGGTARANGDRSSPVANDGAVREDDNDDFCSSCSNSGELVCCDGCVRSFHFNCVDPPLNPDTMPDNKEWFCQVCRTTRDPEAFPSHTGPFAQLFEQLDAKNSNAFGLPGDVRDRFENVRTAPTGEYQDLTVAKPVRKKKSEEETPDFFRLRDGEGKPAICHGCQKHSIANRAIIPCSVCGIFWHTDCLDPPMANPPVLRNWKCPLHIEELLTKLPGQLAPAHRYRKVKASTDIRPAFSRGFINNGYIDIIPESEPASGWKNIEAYGRTVLLPEKGIKLDFLSRARENRKGKPIPPLNAAMPAATSANAQPALQERTLEEQMAARNLTQLSGAGSTNISTLIDIMIAAADPSVIDLMARANASHFGSPAQLNNMDQQSLRAMMAQAEIVQAQIRQLLEAREISNAQATEERVVPVPSLTNSQSDGESEDIAPDLEDGNDDAGKSLASPAATDDVPAMTQGEKTPVLDHSPVVPPIEENLAEEGTLPATPIKASTGGSEPIVVEPHSDDKNGVEENGMDLD
ncbi:hypothetical protein QBC43DRAFT_283691 [Cladorrhinum sp. PSN259]|nr:hypothetical protein QBC43DRAFT_283691 [Cladorrhinum sp. PSN259]